MEPHVAARREVRHDGSEVDRVHQPVANALLHDSDRNVLHERVHRNDEIRFVLCIQVIHAT